jgi:hypothetical protein
MLSTKPPRCKWCKTRTEKLGKVLHDHCIDPWLADMTAKKQRKQAAEQRAQAKVEKAVTRKRREALKRIPDLIKEAQIEFNHFCRVRDAGKPCISCGGPLAASAVGGGFDCGHFRSTGSASHLRFDERNAAGQCKHCNRYLAGNVIGYRIGLIGRIGLEQVEALEADNTPKKWQRDELIAIKTLYREKRKALEKEQA